MSLEQITLIQDWGYWLMFAAAIIEGETFLLLGGIAASAGMLDLTVIIFLSFTGCMIHDSFCFYLGRFLGVKLLKRKVNWQAKVTYIIKLLEKYDFWLIIFFRFAYGLRIIIPFSLGITKISNIKFIVFDIFGGIIWVLIFILGGFYFGNAIEIILHKLSLLDFVKEHWILFTLILFITIALVTYVFIRIFKKKINNFKRN